MVPKWSKKGQEDENYEEEETLAENWHKTALLRSTKIVGVLIPCESLSIQPKP